jgi:tRNA 5-methylaminomethyl-2-thiouridine biosynthesis bifunctional protein
VSWGPLQPAHIHFSAGQAPGAPAFADSYRQPGDAQAMARQVFLAGNGLPGRWAGRRRFVVLEAGFGLGHNFLATWAAWQADAQRCAQLWYLAIDKHPPRLQDLVRAHAHTPLLAQAAALQAAWPPLTPDLHPISLDGGRVQLLLAWGDIAAVLPDLLARVDAFYLDGFAPERNPAMWDAWRLRQLPRLAAPGATLATWSAAEPLRQDLRAAGFVLDAVQAAQPGAPAFTAARFAPRFASPPPPGRAVATGVRQVAVVGAGLAGAAVAQALAGRGLQVTVVDRQPHCAGETSGNPGGLFHGIVHGADGPHARWLRAAALHCQRVLAPLLADGRVAGRLDGLLRGEQALDAPAMLALLQRLALPADYVQVVPAETSTTRVATAAAAARWLYPGGGWVSPAELCAAWLQTPGITTRYGQAVQALQARAGGGWHLMDAQGHALAEADAVVLCNAGDASRLLGPATTAALGGLQRVRGQTTVLPANTPGLPPLHQPWADGGYALRLGDGRLLCGATSQVGDNDPSVRAADHAHNIAALRRLTGWAGDVDATTLDGRVGWRLQSDDRLPLLGPVPDVQALGMRAGAGQRRADQPRFVPRVPGLWLFTALGSRGITQAALGGEVLASWLTGDPVPLPASLLDAVDAARFVSRAVRRQS